MGGLNGPPTLKGDNLLVLATEVELVDFHRFSTMSARLGISIEDMLDIAGEVLREAADALDEDGIPYWITAGTALGLWREGNIIAGDTDIDLAVMNDVSAERIEEVMLSVGFMPNKFNDFNGAAYQRAFVKKGIPVDIAFWALRGEHYILPVPGGYTKKPKHLLRDLQTIRFKGRDYPIPKCPEYLRWRYGDWETPSDSKGVYRIPQTLKKGDDW